MIHVLFVCLGNICRSPMAEAIFKDMVTNEGLADKFRIESAGTGAYHVGESAHYGTRQVLAAHGIKTDSVAQQVSQRDVREADYIIAMDQSNLNALSRLGRPGRFKGEPRLLLEFAPEAVQTSVPDPYYENNFEEVYELVRAGCEGLLEHIKAEEGLS